MSMLAFRGGGVVDTGSYLGLSQQILGNTLTVAG